MRGGVEKISLLPPVPQLPRITSLSFDSSLKHMSSFEVQTGFMFLMLQILLFFCSFSKIPQKESQIKPFSFFHPDTVLQLGTDASSSDLHLLLKM